MDKKISVIIPVLNEITNIDELITRLKNTIIKYNNYEIIFVDDGSTDGTREKLKQISTKQDNIITILLYKSYGHQQALLIGMKKSTGDIIITIDGDLQDPPELIHKMIEKHNKGYDIVNTSRNKRPGEPFWRLFFIKIFYLLTTIINFSITKNAGDFRLMSRKALNALLSFPYNKFFIRILITKIGFNQIYIKYDRNERYSGESKCNFLWLFRFAIDGFIASTPLPLRFIFLKSKNNNNIIEKIIEKK